MLCCACCIDRSWNFYKKPSIIKAIGSWVSSTKFPGCLVISLVKSDKYDYRYDTDDEFTTSTYRNRIKMNSTPFKL